MTEREKVIQLLREPHRFGRYIGFRDLMPLHGDWIHYWRNATEDWSLQGHRNSLKSSTLVTHVTSDLLSYPNRTSLILRKDFMAASKFVEQVGNILLTKKVRHLFRVLYDIDDPQTSHWSKRSINLATRTDYSSKEPNLEAAGVDSGLVGNHYQRIYADDIITKKDRYSRAEREKVKTLIHELENIKVLIGDAIIGFLGTPWHKEDGWELCPPPLKFPVGTVPVRGFGPEKLLNIRKKMPYSLYAINYKLTIVPDEGKPFAETTFDMLPGAARPIFVVDPSYGGENTTAVAGTWTHPRTKKRYITGMVWDKPVWECYEDILNFVIRKRGYKIVIEKNKDEGATYRDLKTRASHIRKAAKIKFSQIHETRPKDLKISLTLGPKWEDTIIDEDSNDEFVSQLCEWEPFLEPDDGPDAAASSASEEEKEKKAGTKKDRKAAIQL